MDTAHALQRSERVGLVGLIGGLVLLTLLSAVPTLIIWASLFS